MIGDNIVWSRRARFTRTWRNAIISRCTRKIKRSAVAKKQCCSMIYWLIITGRCNAVGCNRRFIDYMIKLITFFIGARVICNEVFTSRDSAFQSSHDHRGFPEWTILQRDVLTRNNRDSNFSPKPEGRIPRLKNNDFHVRSFPSCSFLVAQHHARDSPLEIAFR